MIAPVAFILCVITPILSGSAVSTPDVIQIAGGAGFFPAFIASFLLILGSEVGDKTFFIAVIP